MQNGAALRAFIQEIERTLAAAKPYSILAEFREQLEETVRELEAATSELLKVRDNGEITRYLANATIYLDTFGHVVIAWVWLKQAIVAAAAKDAAAGDDADFYRGKIQACQYFFRYELSKVPERLSFLTSVDDTCLEMCDSWF